jgi:signal peptidase I
VVRIAVLVVVLTFVVGLIGGGLVVAGIVVPISAGGSFGMAPTLPPCNGQELAETITFWFRDPRRGDIVAIHTRDLTGNNVTPDSNQSQPTLVRRIVGVPGDRVSVSHGHVLVNSKPADSIRTLPFPSVHLGPKQYFVLGDNRSASQDSRVFGPVPRAAIYARVVLVLWPLRRIGIPGYDKDAASPGFVCAQH